MSDYNPAVSQPPCRAAAAAARSRIEKTESYEEQMDIEESVAEEQHTSIPTEGCLFPGLMSSNPMPSLELSSQPNSIPKLSRSTRKCPKSKSRSSRKQRPKSHFLPCSKRKTRSQAPAENSQIPQSTKPISLNKPKRYSKEFVAKYADIIGDIEVLSTAKMEYVSAIKEAKQNPQTTPQQKTQLSEQYGNVTKGIRRETGEESPPPRLHEYLWGTTQDSTKRPEAKETDSSNSINPVNSSALQVRLPSETNSLYAEFNNPWSKSYTSATVNLVEDYFSQNFTSPSPEKQSETENQTSKDPSPAFSASHTENLTGNTSPSSTPAISQDDEVERFCPAETSPRVNGDYPDERAERGQSQTLSELLDELGC